MSHPLRRPVLAAFALLAALSPAGVASGQNAGDASLAGGTDNAVSAMQGALLSDPTSRDQVMSLQDDPDLKAVLDDPATMRAVNAGDLGALLSDPRIQALLRNPKVRGLVDQQAR